MRALLHEQHPDLAGLGLRQVAGGWDNRMWCLQEAELAVRLPRTPHAPSLLRTERASSGHCIAAPGKTPASPNRGVPLEALGHKFDEWFPVVASGDVAAGVRRSWEQAVAAHAWQDAPVWIHGDLHPANAVVTGGTLSSVIDFGDMCAGDPATAPRGRLAAASRRDGNTIL